MTDLRPCPDGGHCNNESLFDELLGRALTAEARVAQLEAAISDDPLESERLRALIYEALSLIGQGHEPGEYAESVWIAGVVNTLKEVDDGDTDAAPPEP